MINKLFKNKEFQNAGWLIAGKVIQMILSLFVGILTARYLGPANYGLINYGMAYVAFFTAFCVLGLNSILVKEFVNNPEECGVTIGSTIVMRLIASFLSSIMIVAISFVVDYGEKETIVIVALCSIGTIFHVFETFNYWFQAQYKSKITAIGALIAYIAISIYKVILLIFEKDVVWFALATSIEYIVVAVVLWFVYKCYHGPKLKFSLQKCKKLLRESYHFILPSLMVAIYGQTDKLMLKQMVGEAEVGFYATAYHICNMWTFVLAAIIDSFLPTILRLKNKDNALYARKNKQLYSTIIYLSSFVAIVFTVFGDFIVELLYGRDFINATAPLRILSWLTMFSYLGIARGAWLICEKKQKYLKYINGSAACINIGLNLVFIPILGGTGAALASLLTQFCTGIVLPLIIKPMRENSLMMLASINPKYVFSMFKSYENDEQTITKNKGAETESENN